MNLPNVTVNETMILRTNAPNRATSKIGFLPVASDIDPYMNVANNDGKLAKKKIFIHPLTFKKLQGREEGGTVTHLTYIGGTRLKDNL
jgi:hypothetical protein